jgi:signal peptide peptidase SppA
MWEHAYLESLILGTPILMERGKLDVILYVLAPKLRIQAPVVVAAQPRQPREPQPSPSQDIAVIEVMDSLVHRTRGLQAESGMTSYESIGNQLLQCARDPRIGGILLHVDTPGGEVSGAYPLAGIVSQVAKEKPVWAVVDEAAWSAGYLIASQCNRILLSENGSVGSIGICLVHVDESGKDSKDGREYTIMHRGARKIDFSPHGPLSAEAKTFADKLLDREYAMFVDHVARGRKLSPKMVRATEASLIYGQDAIDEGFADDFTTFRDAAAEMASGLQTGKLIASSSPQKGVTSVPEPTQEAPVPHVIARDVTAASPPSPPPQGATATANTPTLTQSDYEEIAETCLIARKPHLTATFIQQRKTVAEVKKILLSNAAEEDEQTEIISTFPPEHGAQNPKAKPQMRLVDRMREMLAVK